MENILIILENKTEKNSELINDCASLIKKKGVAITFCSFVQIPFKYPIDSEDKELQSSFDKAEHLLKSFESNLNQIKIPSSRMNGITYKVRDYFYGVIELSKEVGVDLIILPKNTFENFSEIYNLNDENNVVENISFRSARGINNLVSNLKCSLILWQESN